jgi:hypothetical protein
MISVPFALAFLADNSGKTNTSDWNSLDVKVALDSKDKYSCWINNVQT